MISQQDILNILKNYKDEFIRNFKINSIGLFGSYARNEQEEESDIDLIVEFQEGQLNYDNFFNLVDYLEGIFNCKVDVIPKHSIRPELKKHIFPEIKLV